MPRCRLRSVEPRPPPGKSLHLRELSQSPHRARGMTKAGHPPMTKIAPDHVRELGKNATVVMLRRWGQGKSANLAESCGVRLTMRPPPRPCGIHAGAPHALRRGVARAVPRHAVLAANSPIDAEASVLVGGQRCAQRRRAPPSSTTPPPHNGETVTPMDTPMGPARTQSTLTDPSLSASPQARGAFPARRAVRLTPARDAPGGVVPQAAVLTTGRTQRLHKRGRPPSPRCSRCKTGPSCSNGNSPRRRRRPARIPSHTNMGAPVLDQGCPSRWRNITNPDASMPSVRAATL